MSHNPIYQALRVSGLIEHLEDVGRRTGTHSRLWETVKMERSALRSMWMRGVIDYDQYAALSAKVSRTLHARLLRDALRDVPHGKRRAAVRTVQRICPPGMTSYDFRMGKTARA